jgi:hypothetical protein
MGRQPTLDLRLPRRRKERVDREERSSQEHAGPGQAAAPESEPLFFGEWLVYRRILSRAQVSQALAIGRLHEWRIGDAVVVLRLASRLLVEAEAKRFERHTGRREPRRLVLERRAQRLMREEQTRRIRRAAAGDRLPG